MAAPIVEQVGEPTQRSATVTTTKSYSLDPELGKESITAITPLSGLPLGSYYQVEQDKKGNLWFITSYELIKYDGNSFIRYSALPVKEGSFDQMAIDPRRSTRRAF